MKSTEFAEIVISDYKSVTEKYNALYELRTICDSESLKLLISNFDKINGDLLQHETAQVFGQVFSEALDSDADLKSFLIKVMDDKSYCAITRHEAAEALCHSKDPNLISRLQEISVDPNEPEELRETCFLSLNYIKDAGEEQEETVTDGNQTRDPSVLFEFGNDFNEASNEEKVKILYDNMNKQISKWREEKDEVKKYDILNNMQKILMHFKNQLESITHLIEQIKMNDLSPVFLHEIGFFIGQMLNTAQNKDQSKNVYESTKEVFEDDKSHRMVKHELACAQQSLVLDKKYSTDFVKDISSRIDSEKDDLVKESLIIGRDNAISAL